MIEKHFSGTGASTGLHVGRAIIVGIIGGNMREKLEPEDEKSALKTAINDAIASTGNLIATLGGAEAEILNIQNALLSDDALTETVWPQIEAGVSAHDAWHSALDIEIAGYLASQDEYFRARSTDLIDIRDRVSAHFFGGPKPLALAGGEIIIAHDLAPSLFMEIEWSHGGGIILGAGSTTSHVAMLARAKSIPMVIGVGDIWKDLHGTILMDGGQGSIIENPSSETKRLLSSEIKVQSSSQAREIVAEDDGAITADGIKISVMLNIASLDDIATINANVCNGIGLTRTEFFVRDAIFHEDVQFDRYVALLKWANGRPVTIRTIDAGGDKPLEGYTSPREANPFLGQRGIRLSLLHLDIFNIQLRALLRAAAFGPLKIMLPMVTRPLDVEDARAAVSAVKLELLNAGVPFGECELGMMVEVPAVALCPQIFNVDFYSIGSNDLTQYATAASRDNGDVADYADTAHPGVMAMIEHVADYGNSAGKPVSLCGDAGSDPHFIHALLKAGIRTLSVPPAALLSTNAVIRSLTLTERI